MKNKKKLFITLGVILVVLVASYLLLGPVGIWYDILAALIIGVSLTGFKKHGLLKVIFIIMLLLIIVSNVLPGRQGIIDRIGIADILVNYYSIILQNFSYLVLFILTVGGFYGVLNKVPAYKKLLDNIVLKVKPLGKKFIFMMIILFSVITSLTGITIPLFIFIPFVVSIILLMGYDKLVAYSSTFAAIIVGYIGGIFVSFVNPNTYGLTTYEEFVGMESKLANTYPKLLLLLAGIALLIYFVNQHIKNVEKKKVNYKLTDNSDLLIAEVKGSYKNLHTWPLICVFVVTFVILVLGMVPWNGLFEIKVFSDFHEWLIGLKIGDFEVIPSIISSSLPALGGWLTGGNLMSYYVYASMLVVFMTVIVALVNKVKVNDVLDNFGDGIKKLLPIAGLITVAYSVLVFAFNNGFIETLISNYGKFNFGISSLLALLGCIINVDTTWIVVGIFAPIVNLITDAEIYPAVSMMLRGIYGLSMLVGPTSLIMIIGLTYLDIPYTTWLKYIWRFILGLIILIALVTLLVIYV